MDDAEVADETGSGVGEAAAMGSARSPPGQSLEPQDDDQQGSERPPPGQSLVPQDDDHLVDVVSNGSDDELVDQAASTSSESERTYVSMARGTFKRCNRARIFAGKVVNSDRSQVFIVFLIAINAIMLGIGTFDFVYDDPEVKNIFDTIDQVFLVIFTIELGLQFLYHGWRLFIDGWLMFDLVVITMSWAFEQVQVVRAFRIFRALRLVTRIKTMKNLVLALFGVMPRITAISLLLFLIFYIFAVMCTALFDDLYERGFYEDWDYFGRLDRTFFTLFQIMTLDNWAAIVRDTIDAYSWAWLPMLTFVVITGFIVVNLIIAVICDAISALNEDDKAKMHGTYESEEISAEKKEQRRSRRRSSSSLTANHHNGAVHEQIEALHSRVEELQRVQNETKVAMSRLTAYVQMRRLSASKKERD